MLETKISAGCMAMCLLWLIGVGLIIVGDRVHHLALGQLGLVFSATGLCISILTDNHRTRRMLRRPNEHIGPMRLPSSDQR